jgi:hypothetical protein
MTVRHRAGIPAGLRENLEYCMEHRNGAPHSNGVPRSYDEAVRTLASWHTEGLPGGALVFHFPDPQRQTIRLLEISGEFPVSGDTRPFAFGRSEEFPFRSAVIQVTPEEWADIQAGRMPLPPDWDLASGERIDPHA